MLGPENLRVVVARSSRWMLTMLHDGLGRLSPHRGVLVLTGTNCHCPIRFLGFVSGVIRLIPNASSQGREVYLFPNCLRRAWSRVYKPFRVESKQGECKSFRSLQLSIVEVSFFSLFCRV